jgi:hypothetical protein
VLHYDQENFLGLPDVKLSRRAATRSGAMAIGLWLEAAFKLFC